MPYRNRQARARAAFIARGGTPAPTPGPAPSPSPLTIMFVGSSTPERYFTVAGGPANPEVSTSLNGASFTPTTTASAGRGAKVFGDHIQRAVSRPIRLLGRGKSGSRVSDWNDDGDVTRTNAVNAAIAAGGVDMVVFILGFNDANAGSSLTQTQHTANLRSLFSKLRTELGKPNLPIVMGMSQKSGTAGDAARDGRFNALYAAENAVLSDPNVYFGAHVYDLPQVDGIHLEEPQYDVHGLRLARNITSVLQGQALARGPSVTAVDTISPTETRVTLSHSTGTDFTPTSGITGLQVSTDNFSTLLTISSVVRLSATEVAITHAEATAGATLAVRLMAGAVPDRSNPIKDNSVATLPVNPTPANLTDVVPAGTGTPALSALTVSPSTATIGSPYSGTISGLTAGSSIALTGAGAAGLSVTGSSITGTPTTAGGINLVETLAGATGSPRTTTGVVTVSAAASASSFSDTFTGADGTNLTAHTSDSGHTWSAVTGTILIGGNTAYGTGGTAYLSSFAPPSANYTVKAKLKFLSLISGYQAYILGRATAPGGTRTHYSLGYLQGGASGEGIYLGKVVSGGSFTVFGFYPYTAVAGAAPELGLVMVGDQISATMDGTVIIPPVTDTSITAIGTVGLRTTAAAGVTTGPHFDDLTVA